MSTYKYTTISVVGPFGMLCLVTACARRDLNRKARANHLGDVLVVSRFSAQSLLSNVSIFLQGREAGGGGS